jgi:hypothetical protein
LRSGWAKQGHHTYGLLEYFQQEKMKLKLGLDPSYRFAQCDEDEEIIAAHKTTGHKIRWNGHGWVDYDSGD